LEEEEEERQGKERTRERNMLKAGKGAKDVRIAINDNTEGTVTWSNLDWC
jgi:hypothetical protein